MRVRVSSLFSGVGGLDLGVERGLYAAGVQADTVFQCEADEFGRSVLRRHWPAAEVCEDVRSIDKLPPCELLIAGFPCQGISTAGKGRGLEDERSALFFEIVRLLRVAGSSVPYVLLENTPAINSRGLDRVLWELAGLGYNARWGVISAGSLGYGHRRRRWFLVAWLADSNYRMWRNEPSIQGRQPPERGVAMGASNRVNGCGSVMANDDSERGGAGPWIPAGSGSDLSDPDRGDGCGSSLAYSNGRRQESRRNVAGVGRANKPDTPIRSRAGARPFVAGLGDPADGVPSWVARCRRPVAAPGRPQFSYEPPRTKQRERGDKQRLRALGNAVVPGQVAAVAYWLGLLMRGVV